MRGTENELWHGVDRLIDRAPSIADLRAHGLHLLAARRWRAQGRPVPEELSRAETAAACRELNAFLVLERIRDFYDGRMILLKGPEVAAHYPDACRPYGDLDILAEEPELAQQALLAAGFEPIGFNDSYYEGLHHLRPLRLPEVPSPIVEIHRRPNWLEWVSPPPRNELFASAVPTLCGADGFLALPPPQQALALAAHSWIELPLRRILDLIDVLVVAPSACARSEALALASHWEMERVWRTMIAAAEALLLCTSMPSSLRIWARNLRDVRDRTVFENHTRRWLSGFWALPLGAAVRASLAAVGKDLTPAATESWANKLRRAREAAGNPSRSAADHVHRLGPDAKRGRFKRG